LKDKFKHNEKTDHLILPFFGNPNPI
jgi:hypothetical protein